MLTEHRPGFVHNPGMSTPPTPLLWHTLPHAPPPGTVLLHQDALQDGQVLMHDVPGEAQDKAFRLLLLRSGERITAYANRCAHFGVPLADKQTHLKFVPHTSITCNVHYARFRWDDGVCDRGDCEGDSLIAVPVHSDEHGMLRIGPSA